MSTAYSAGVQLASSTAFTWALVIGHEFIVAGQILVEFPEETSATSSQK